MMNSDQVLKCMVALILVFGYIHCDPRQNADTLYTLYNSRRGENTVIRVQPERKIEPGYGYPPGDQEALYQLYNGGITQIDFPQTDGEVYVIRKDLDDSPIIGGQGLPLQQVTESPANDHSVSIAQLQLRQKQLQQSQQLQQAQPQLPLHNQENKREQQLLIQTGSTQQAPNSQKQTADPLPSAVYGVLIKQQPGPTGGVKGREEGKPISTPLLRPESRIVPQAVPQQQGNSNNVRLPPGLQPSNGLPVLPPIFGVHNGVLGKVPLPFPDVPAYSISQYGSTPQKQPSIGNGYLNTPSPAAPVTQKVTNENIPLRLPNAQPSDGRLPQKQLPAKDLTVTRNHPAPQPQTVYFDDEKDRLTSVSYENPASSRPTDEILRKPLPIQPNERKQGDQLKLLSSFQNQEKAHFQGAVRGAAVPLAHTSLQQQDLTKSSNQPTHTTSYHSQIQPSSINAAGEKFFTEKQQENKPRIRNQNEEYPLGHSVDHLGLSDESDFGYDDYSPSHGDDGQRKKKANRNTATIPDSPPVIQEPIPTTTLPPTSPIPVETVSQAPTQPDYSQNYESSDNSNDDEEDVPPYFFSDEDRFGSRISKGAQQEAPIIQQSTLIQAQPAALLSAQLSVQESQSSFPAAALTPSQAPDRIGVGRYQQPPNAFNAGGPNTQLPQTTTNILPQQQAQLQNIPYQQGYGVQQQIPSESGSLKRGQAQHSTIAYNQEAVNQNSNGFQNQRPLLTQQKQPLPAPAPPSFVPATQHPNDDLDKKQTQEAPKRQRGRRRKNRQRGNRNRQAAGRTTSNSEQQLPIREVEKPQGSRNYQQQQQQQYVAGQSQFASQQLHQNVPPSLNNRPNDLSSGLGYPANRPQIQNLQTNINSQQSDQSYSRGTANNPSQYFTRNNNQQLPNSHQSITPNLVSYPEVTTKPSTPYRSNQETETIRIQNSPRQAPYRQSQQPHPQYNVESTLNPQTNYQNSQPQSYPSSYNVPIPRNTPSHFLHNNAAPSQNPSLYRQESVPQRVAGNYGSDLSQQQSTFDVSSVQQTQGKIRQQPSLNLEDKPVPSLPQTTTPPPVQEATTTRSTNRSRFGQRRKGRGRSRQQKNRPRNTVKENPQDQQENVNDRAPTQQLPPQQQGHANNPQAPQGNQPFNQQLTPSYNTPPHQQQHPQQNPAYNLQTEPKQQFFEAPLSNSYGRQQQQQTVAQQYSGLPQQYNPPQQIPNYRNVQKQPELGANLQSSVPSPQVPYSPSYDPQQQPLSNVSPQQQPQLQTANLPQQSPQNAGNNPYLFQPNYGQGNYQAAQSSYPLQPNSDSQFYKRADIEDVDDDYAEEGEINDGEEYDN